jgi:hypothetical protein
LGCGALASPAVSLQAIFSQTGLNRSQLLLSLLCSVVAHRELASNESSFFVPSSTLLTYAAAGRCTSGRPLFHEHGLVFQTHEFDEELPRFGSLLVFVHHQVPPSYLPANEQMGRLSLSLTTVGPPLLSVSPLDLTMLMLGIFDCRRSLLEFIIALLSQSTEPNLSDCRESQRIHRPRLSGPAHPISPSETATMIASTLGSGAMP